MKLKLMLPVVLACAAGPLMAGPLAKENVAQNAKWLLHIDLDQLRNSRLGQYLLNEVVVKKVDDAKTNGNSFLTNVDVLKVIGQLHSLTVYGTNFETGPNFDGVLMLQVEPETRKILEGMAAGLLLKDDGTLTKTNEEGNIIYSLKDQMFASPRETGLILLSKSKASLKQAAAVSSGKSKSLVGSKAFTDFPPVSDTFMFLAVAEGFQDNLSIPPQAKVLRQADGIRLVLGEKASNLFMNIALKAKDSEVVKQIQQVVEGMVALGSLSQSDNKELQQLVQSVKVVASDKVLSVTAAYPVEAFLARAGQMLAEKAEHRHHHKAEAEKSEKPESSAGDSQ